MNQYHRLALINNAIVSTRLPLARQPAQKLAQQLAPAYSLAGYCLPGNFNLCLNVGGPGVARQLLITNCVVCLHEAQLELII